MQNHTVILPLHCGGWSDNDQPPFLDDNLQDLESVFDFDLDETLNINIGDAVAELEAVLDPYDLASVLDEMSQDELSEGLDDCLSCDDLEILFDPEVAAWLLEIDEYLSSEHCALGNITKSTPLFNSPKKIIYKNQKLTE